jgi:hypothetical protein
MHSVNVGHQCYFTGLAIEMTASTLKLGQYRRYSDTDITLTRGQTHAI